MRMRDDVNGACRPLVGRLLGAGRAPVDAAVEPRGLELFRQALAELRRQGAVASQALYAEMYELDAQRGGNAREWRGRHAAARRGAFAAADTAVDLMALCLADVLGPDPISSDDVGTGLDADRQRLMAALVNRGLARRKAGA